jgi:enamine deaminase RidA (YjgF/YER057c/UK114 family)
VAIERINPPKLMEPRGYCHAVAARGARTLYLAGQGAYDREGKLVGKGDLRAQTEQAMSNLLVALEAAGATPDDVVKMNIYVVGLEAIAVTD